VRLPQWESAWVHPSKLTDYLLSETHEEGAGKAAFLRSVGFSESNADLLEAGLLAIAHEEEVARTEVTPYGVKYVVYGTMHAPDGEIIELLTVWSIDAGQESPRLVTAYPRHFGRWRSSDG